VGWTEETRQDSAGASTLLCGHAVFVHLYVLSRVKMGLHHSLAGEQLGRSSSPEVVKLLSMCLGVTQRDRAYSGNCLRDDESRAQYQRITILLYHSKKGFKEIERYSYAAHIIANPNQTS
jgi:hypothetical protein